MERQVFNRQPARALLLDLQMPMDGSTCSNIHRSLKDVLSLAVHLLGTSTGRIPLFSLFVLRGYTECLFPLQPIKGNLPRLQGALMELKSICNELLLTNRRQTRNSLLDGIQESLSQYHSLVQVARGDHTSSTSESSPTTQIELVILTAQNSSTIQQSIERILPHLELEYLKKIQIVAITDPDKLMEENNEEEMIGSEGRAVSCIDDEGISITDSHNNSELSLGVFDTLNCNNDVTSLQSLFKSWFHDCSTDSEHIQLILPSKDDNKIVLKCDVIERMIHPFNLPNIFSKNFVLQTGSSSTSTLQSQPSGRSQSPTSVPVYRLKCIGTVSCDGICESVVYGVPCIIRNTCCWKLDWDELEANQHHFQALCFHLRDRNQGLLLTSDVSVNSQLPQVLASYVLLPSTSPSSLLLKAVACNELLLPVDLGESETQQLSPESVDTIGDSLSKLEYQEVYNPLSTHSQLYSVIEATATNTTAGGGGRKAGGVSAWRGGGGGGRRGRGGRGAGQTKRKSTELADMPLQAGASISTSYSVTGGSSGSRGGGRGGSAFSLKKPRTSFIYGGSDF